MTTKNNAALPAPDLVYRVTDKDRNTLHLGCNKGDIVGVVIGKTGPLPFRVVATNAGHGRMSLEPLGGEARSPSNLITGEDG